MYIPDHQPHLDPNPVLPVEQMTGADIAEPLAWLAGHMVDSVVVDGYSFTSVRHRSEERDGSVQAICTTDDGTELLLNYSPADAVEPVTHVIFPAKD